MAVGCRESDFWIYVKGKSRFVRRLVMECEGKENAEDLGVEKLGKIWVGRFGSGAQF